MSTSIIVFNRIIFYATTNPTWKTVFEKHIPMYILYKGYLSSMILFEMCPVAYVMCCRLCYVHMCIKTHFSMLSNFKSRYIHLSMLSLIWTNYLRCEIYFIFRWPCNAFGPNSHGSRLIQFGNWGKGSIKQHIRHWPGLQIIDKFQKWISRLQDYSVPYSWKICCGLIACKDTDNSFECLNWIGSGDYTNLLQWNNMNN